MKNGLKDCSDELKILGSIIESVRVGMLTSGGPDHQSSSRPMYVQEVDADAQIWFFTSTSSLLIEQIRQKPAVSITFADSKDNKFLFAHAMAAEVHDKTKMEQLWDPTLKAWFKDGLETPDIVLLKLAIEKAEYWDAPNSSVVQLVGLVKAIVSDKTYDPGRHGVVNVRH